MNVSVITPAFNAEKTIGKTLNSLLSQSVVPKEIIVVNDGSTDKTKEIVEGIAVNNNSIKLFSRKNQGISASRNFGAGKAKEEVIAFLDSDVIVETQWLEKLLNGLQENVFAVCGKYSIESDGSLASDFFSFSISSSSFQGYNIALRKKDFLESKGFNEKMKYCEDPEFFLRAFTSGKTLNKTSAESFHESYPLKKRVKPNFNYSFFDGVLFKKNFSFFINPFNLIKAPENIKMIYSFYWIEFLSVILSVEVFLISKNLFSAGFLFLPSLIGIIKLISNKNQTKYKNNFLAVLVYSFFALILFEVIKSFGFINGLIQGKL